MRRQIRVRPVIERGAGVRYLELKCVGHVGWDQGVEHGAGALRPE
jgi:hypothetical protein